MHEASFFLSQEYALLFSIVPSAPVIDPIVMPIYNQLSVLNEVTVQWKEVVSDIFLKIKIIIINND